ncbi:MAG: VWA domain-containing protein [Acidobacteriota bacterium]
MNRFVLLSALTLVLVSGFPAVAQQHADLFLDTVDVRVINLEVMVTDRQGETVTGLEREDFEVLEDGEPVALTNFLAVEQRQVRQSETGPEGYEEGGYAREPDTRQLQLVIFVDENNIDPRNRNQLFGRLRTTLDEQWRPEDRAMMVSLGSELNTLAPFTSDVADLHGAIDALDGRVGGYSRVMNDYHLLQREIQRAALETPVANGLANPFFDSAVRNAEQLARRIRLVAEQRNAQTRRTIEHLGSFVRTLASLPGRKALLFLSDGLPTQPADPLVEAWRGKFESWAVQYDQNSMLSELTSLGSLDFDATSHIDDLVEEAAAHRVAFYPITPGARSAASGLSAEFQGSGTTDGSGAYSRTVQALEQMSLESSLMRLADETGGLAFTRTLNLDALMERIREDVTTFYSLGYSPTREEDQAYHEVEVRIKGRRDLNVRHLQGFREKGAMEKLQDRTLSALHHGITDNILGVRLEPGEAEATGKDRYEVAVMVKIPFEKVLLLPQGENHQGRLSLLVAVRDDQGRVSPFQEIELPIQIPNEQVLSALSGAAAYPMRLEMRGGPHRISLGVRDRIAQTDSTVNLEMTVGAKEPSR